MVVILLGYPIVRLSDAEILCIHPPKGSSMLETLFVRAIVTTPFDVVTQPLLAGTVNDGWYGEVTAPQLISGPALAAAIGLTVGAAMPNNAGVPWLHYTTGGKRLLVAKTCHRNNLMWNSLDALGVVFGTKTITIGPHTYKVRLIKGAPGGEWDKLLYKVSENDPTGTFWARNTDAQLGMNGSIGSAAASYCQDIHSTIYVYERANPVTGSGAVVTRSRGMNKDIANGYIGWRPVLELIS